MSRCRTLATPVVVFALASGIALASWYDDYDAGLNAARKGQWQVVVQKMTAAINVNSKENDKARTYGAIFINYHPYYYRAVAYLNLGNYEKAIADLEQASGPGEENLGSIETLMQRAKSKLAATTTTEPPPPTVPVPTPPPPTVPVPTPVQPTGPSMDPALVHRATAAINEAQQRLAKAQKRKATQSPQYKQALDAFTDARTRNATAKSNDDLKAVIAVAENAASFADAATATVVTTTDATQIVLGDTARRVRQALESYFSGDFDDAATQFTRLSREMPKNGWIWAFLGASQYSQYAFEADESYKAAAMQSFRKAKQLRPWQGGLPQKYFSKRIRRVFENAG